MKTLLTNKIHYKDLQNHETKRNVVKKFLLLLTILVVYFLFITGKYGIEQGIFVTALTRSFFVLCTPIADAGFLIDFPLRLITRIRMTVSEICVWLIAISLNIYTFFFHPAVYEQTKLLQIFKEILQSPLPFRSIILISAIGTFVSVTFGDELIDKVKHHQRTFYHKNKRNYRLIIIVFLFVISLVVYDILLQKLGVNIPSL